MDANQTGTRIQALDALRGSLCAGSFSSISRRPWTCCPPWRAPEGLRLFVLGFALAQLRVPDLVGRWIGLTFSMAMAAVYAAGFLALLHTAAGPALSGLLAPIGRLALTNYLTATLLFVPLGAALGLRGSTDFGTTALLGAVILLAQAVWSPCGCGGSTMPRPPGFARLRPF